jgi:tetratricopeptide (TPR) repeat protein
MQRGFLYSLLALLTFAPVPLLAQTNVPASSPNNEEIVQITPPPRPRAAAPSADATVEELETRGDDLRAEKAYFDAVDYYRTALAKDPKNARIYNKAGIAELQMHHFKQSAKYFERAFKFDRQFADACNNLGVVYYEEKKYGPAVRQYQEALQLKSGVASYYSNLGAVYYTEKEWDKAAASYGQAVELDPNIFERTSKAGVSAQLTSPSERAHFDYLLAKLFAKQNDRDRSLEYLRRAMEDGYKGIGDVYKDPDFAALRSDTRFTSLMAAKPPGIPE